MSTDVSPVEAANPEVPSALTELVSRVGALYSLPTVASEVIELTNNPKVDVRALKACIERDPALTLKLLRVVNSSLFGLSREVSDLNQALALLGIQPLKLLVLGFSLPESLFAEIAHTQLNWYWRGTLTRAVAAREISEQLFGRPGDEAFLAGLLQDIGILVLLGQFRFSYTKFLDRMIEDGVELATTEREALGFDHFELGATLLETWNMPPRLVEAVAAANEEPVPSLDVSSLGQLKRVMQLAHLLAELVGNNRLSVLPRLLDLGGQYCGLDKSRLKDLVHTLQPRVQQLAQVLRVELSAGRNYAEILVEAHQRMAKIAEAVAEPLSRHALMESQLTTDIFEETQELQAAVDDFLLTPRPGNPHGHQSQEPQSTADDRSETPEEETPSISFASSFSQRLTLFVGQCRSQRQPLSLLLFQVTESSSSDGSHSSLLQHLLATCCTGEYGDAQEIEFGSACSLTVVLSNCDRREAIEYAQLVIRKIERALSGLAQRGSVVEATTRVGIASVTLPPKNFEPARLLQTAERCLQGAQQGGTSLIKSLEIY